MFGDLGQSLTNRVGACFGGELGAGKGLSSKGSQKDF